MRRMYKIECVFVYLQKKSIIHFYFFNVLEIIVRLDKLVMYMGNLEEAKFELDLIVLDK